MRNYCLALACFILSCAPLFAQNDYVATTRGDTLYGQVVFRSYNKQPDKVMLKNEEGKKLYAPIQLKALHSKKNTFHTVKHNGRYEFMKLVQGGYLSVYFRKADEQWEYAEMVLTKRDGSSVSVPNLSFRKTMVNFLDGCEVVKKRVNDRVYGKKEMEAIVKEYNECITQNTARVSLNKVTQPATTQQPRPEPVDMDTPQFKALSEIKGRLKTSTNIQNKQEVYELIDDLESRLMEKKPIPSYLIAPLREYFEADQSIAYLVEQFVESLNKK